MHTVKQDTTCQRNSWNRKAAYEKQHESAELISQSNEEEEVELKLQVQTIPSFSMVFTNNWKKDKKMQDSSAGRDPPHTTRPEECVNDLSQI